MNNQIKLAVAAALLAAASSANAGISIPAGDWTLDIGGVVNAYYTSTKVKGAGSVSNITTGLLPNYLSVSGKTRQNDLDVGFTISIQPGSSTTQSGIQGGTDPGLGVNSSQENRQAFLTFGDASWGSIKLGKDIGIFASDAILNDMTLLGVGNGAGGLAGNTTTTGRIGNGYIYADWKAQAAYTTPNFNGFSATAGVTQSWNALGTTSSDGRGGSQPAFEAKASYAWTGDVAGKVWVSALSQKITGLRTGAGTSVSPYVDLATTSTTAHGYDIGANINAAGFGVTAYYFQAEGMGGRTQFANGLDAHGNKRDSDGYYVQGTYTIPTVGTKIGLSYGESNVDGTALDTAAADTQSNMWTVGAYHPLTKHLNLVAEYSKEVHEVNNLNTADNKTVSLGAILFF